MKGKMCKMNSLFSTRMKSTALKLQHLEREVAFGGSDPKANQCFQHGTQRCKVEHHFCACGNNKEILNFGFILSFYHLPPLF